MFPVKTTVATRYAPIVTWALIGTNVLVFLYQLSLPPGELERFLARYALIPARYFAPATAGLGGLEGIGGIGALGNGGYLPFLSNIFLHGSLFHILSNMWMLWLFGPGIEDRLGHVRYLVFYLLCGVGASAAHAFVNASSPIPALGASGAIAGIMGAYMRLFPLSRMLVVVPVFIFPFFFEMHASLFVGIWFAIQLIQGLGGLLSGVMSITGGIAWWAHIGGFVVGWLAISLVRLSPERYRAFYRDEGVHGFLPDGRRIGEGPWR